MISLRLLPAPRGLFLAPKPNTGNMTNYEHLTINVNDINLELCTLFHQFHNHTNYRIITINIGSVMP